MRFICSDRTPTWRLPTAQVRPTYSSDTSETRALGFRGVIVESRASTVGLNRIGRRWPVRYLLAKQAADQFDSRARGTAPLVEEGVEFDDIDRSNQPGIVQHLHYQMRFSIGRATGHRGADAGRHAGIEKINVETDVQHAVAGFHLVDDAADQHANAELIDLAHIGNADAAAAQQIFLQFVDRAHAE